MTPQHFREIEELDRSAYEKTGAEREALLVQANPEMRREVEELLAQTPIYVRGLAYLAMRRGAGAANEFGRLLAHPGLAAGDPIPAAARRQLARASAGDAKATSAYQAFLTPWMDADRNIPILKQAQVEYSTLR